MPIARGAAFLLAVGTALGAAACGGKTAVTPDPPAAVNEGATSGPVKTVFVIVMENRSWRRIVEDGNARYVTEQLLPRASYATNYRNPPYNHPSETNYLWMEAGSNLGVTDDASPATNHQATTDHLVSALERAGVSWRSYQEGIDGRSCPLENDNATGYAVRHNPMVFFDDVTDSRDAGSAHCIEHVRPYGELSRDLARGSVARYNFITPSICHDMHGKLRICPLSDTASGDAWLAREVPKILESDAFRDRGALFLTWDECEEVGGQTCEDPIGMVVLSPLAKGGGYHTNAAYDHSSLLRTMHEIFGVRPYLRGAAYGHGLGELFQVPIGPP